MRQLLVERCSLLFLFMIALSLWTSMVHIVRKYVVALIGESWATSHFLTFAHWAIRETIHDVEITNLLIREQMSLPLLLCPLLSLVYPIIGGS